jgi:hypothetical protein
MVTSLLLDEPCQRPTKRGGRVSIRADKDAAHAPSPHREFVCDTWLTVSATIDSETASIR